MSEKIILVLGATGNQGSAVARNLLKTDFKIRAFTRDANSEKSRQLAAKEVEVIQGDLDNLDSLKQAMKGVYGVFSVQNFIGVGVDKEAEQGIRVADAAFAMGVKHFVYTSVGGADRKSGVSHFESKWRIEQHIHSLGLPYTILRPTLVMDNFQAGFKFVMLSLMRSITKEKPVQMISLEDIGKWTTIVFQNPETYLGKSIEIASDALNYHQLQDAFKRVNGKQQPSIWIPPFLVFSMMKEIGDMFKWFHDHGYQADIEYSLKTLQNPIRFEQWITGKSN
ncbi:MAG TPA: NmrA/HSCARG family protein [Anaerolineales bacterium]|nr:NmrA/HSCARG family protein [Anaerolineales bacterium]